MSNIFGRSHTHTPPRTSRGQEAPMSPSVAKDSSLEERLCSVPLPAVCLAWFPLGGGGGGGGPGAFWALLLRFNDQHPGGAEQGWKPKGSTGQQVPLLHARSGASRRAKSHLKVVCLPPISAAHSCPPAGCLARAPAFHFRPASQVSRGAPVTSGPHVMLACPVRSFPAPSQPRQKPQRTLKYVGSI